MQKEEIDIIYSLLVQVGGPISHSDLPINYPGGNEFYEKWDKYISRVLSDLNHLNKQEGSFLASVVEFIVKKIGWELSTVTKYSDQEILEAVSKLKKEFGNVTVKDGLIGYLPEELKE